MVRRGSSYSINQSINQSVSQIASQSINQFAEEAHELSHFVQQAAIPHCTDHCDAQAVPDPARMPRPPHSWLALIFQERRPLASDGPGSS